MFEQSSSLERIGIVALLGTIIAKGRNSLRIPAIGDESELLRFYLGYAKVLQRHGCSMTAQSQAIYITAYR